MAAKDKPVDDIQGIIHSKLRKEHNSYLRKLCARFNLSQKGNKDELIQSLLSNAPEDELLNTVYPEYSVQKRKGDSSRKINIWSLALGVVALALTLLAWLMPVNLIDAAEKENGGINTGVPHNPDSTSTTFSILIFPFGNVSEAPKSVDAGYLIKQRFDEIKSKESLDIHALYVESALSKNFNMDSAQRVLDSTGFDLLIYGSQYNVPESCADGAMRVQYATREEYNISDFPINDGDPRTILYRGFAVNEIIRGEIVLEPEQVVRYALALKDFNAGQYKNAYSGLRKYLLRPTDSIPKALELAAVCLYKLRAWQQSLEYAFRLLDLTPRNDSLLNNIGFTFQMMKDTVSALEFYGKSLLVNPDGIPALDNRAHLSLKTGAYSRAYQDLHRILKLNPDYCRAFSLLGDFYARWNGKYWEGIKWYKRSMECGMEDFASALNMATSYKMLNCLESSRMVYDKIIELYPSSIVAYSGRAKVYDKLGDTLRAEQDLLKTVALDSCSPEYLLQISMFYRNAGQMWNAVKYREKAYIHSAGDPDILAYLISLYDHFGLVERRDSLLCILSS